MDIWRIFEALFIAAVMAVLCRVERRDPEKGRMVLANSFVWTVGAIVPFALIDMLSAFGIRLMDVPWALSPLDVMSMIALISLLVLTGKKLFGMVAAK